MWEIFSRGLTPYPGVDNLDIRRLLKRGDRLERAAHVPNEM